MRLRRKPWIDEAIREYDSHIILSGQEAYKGRWREALDVYKRQVQRSWCQPLQLKAIRMENPLG